LKTSISGTTTSLQTFMPFTDASFINDCLRQVQPVLHFNRPLRQFNSLTSRILFCARLHCFRHFVVTGFRPELLR